MQTLKKGSRGEDVKTLQKALNLIADGIFGTITEEAVKNFQKKCGLVADGIVGAKTWAALMPTGTLIKSKRAINRIIIHCTASYEGQTLTVDQIRTMHKRDRGFSDIGYHYVIYADGSVHEGRSVDLIGAHTQGYNSHSIGVVYVGGLRKENGKTITADTRTPQQKAALVKLVEGLRKLYNLGKDSVYGHYEFANKACPCFDVKKEFRQ